MLVDKKILAGGISMIVVGMILSGDNILPEGTYFYSIIWGNQTEPSRGFVYIKRRNN